VREEAEKIDAYFDSENGYFQPANFILRNRRVINATYSSGPFGAPSGPTGTDACRPLSRARKIAAELKKIEREKRRESKKNRPKSRRSPLHPFLKELKRRWSYFIRKAYDNPGRKKPNGETL